MDLFCSVTVTPATLKCQVAAIQELLKEESWTAVVRYRAEGSASRQTLLEIGGMGLQVHSDGTLALTTGNTRKSSTNAVRISCLGRPAENTLAITVQGEDVLVYANGRRVLATRGVRTSGAVSLAAPVQWCRVSPACSRETLEKLTGETAHGVLVFPSDSPLHCNYYRIPSLLTLKSGRVVAAADARFGGTHDAKSHIAIAVNHSDDGGKTWSGTRYAMHLSDYADQKTLWPTDIGLRDLQIQGCACFIDPVMVEDRKRGRLFLMADMMPAGVGSPNSRIGNGFVCHEGVPCLKLRRKEDPREAYFYSLRQGVIFDDRTNTPTEYTVNQDMEVAFRGMPLTVQQYRVDIHGEVLEETQTDVTVPMHLFYRDSLFQVFPTNYLAMVYSDDDGAHWSPVRLLSDLKPEEEKLLVTGPGVGIQIRRGQWAGRLVVPVYSTTKTNFGVLYSDDGGDNWHYAPTDPPGEDTTGEPQIFELPDGSLRAYLRTDRSQVVFRTSVDGGIHWSSPQRDPALPATCYGTQLSVVCGEMAGRPVVFLSAPASTTGRNTGVVHMGTIIDTGKPGALRYRVDWVAAYPIDGNVGFSYSCLSLLPDGDLGILYEKYDSWCREQLHSLDCMVFETIPAKIWTSER